MKNNTLAMNEINCLNKFRGNPRICQMLRPPLQNEKYTFCILQYYPNGDLFDKIQTHYRTVTTVRKLMSELSTLIKICHDQKIAHLDIKPENFMFDKDMKLVLVDFGMSRAFEQPNTLHFSDHSLGSETYASPETQVQMYSAKSDIWSLGIIFRYLCSCLHDVPDDFETMLQRMLQYEVADRPTIDTVIDFFK